MPSYRAGRVRSAKDMKNICLHIALTSAAFASCLPDLCADEPSHYQFEQKVNGQNIIVLLTTGPFDVKAHKVTHKSISEGYFIDGQRPLGNQGGTTAITEFKRFDISWNGTHVFLPRHVWSTVFNVPLVPIRPMSEETAGLAIVPAIDGSSVLFYFRPHSGDAEDPEEAWLFINRDGTWKKFHSNELPH